MGGGHFDSKTFDTYATSRGYATKTPDEVVNRIGVLAEFLPTNFKDAKRESRDSVDNPLSTPIIIAGDVTGSMGKLAGELIKTGLATLLPEVYSRKPVSDPHVMVMAIGDANKYDRFPIQATQFEADIRIVQQLEGLFVEGGGGNNNNESYMLAWVVAALMTQHDCWEKRNKKGVLFTYGDENVSDPIPAGRLKELLGIDFQADMTAQDALTAALRTYDAYHLIIEEGHYAAAHKDEVRASWTALLGERAIPVSDYTKLPEIITSILQIRGGADKAAVVGSWSGDTAVVVAKAVGGLQPITATPKAGVVTI